MTGSRHPLSQSKQPRRQLRRLARHWRMEPMKILVVSIPVNGHMNPDAGGSTDSDDQRARRRHLHGIGFSRPRRAAGAKFFPFPPEADLDLTDPFARVPELKVLPPGPQWRRTAMERLFVDNIPAQHEGLRRFVDSFGPDVIVGDDMFFGVLPMLLGTGSNCSVWRLGPALAARKPRPRSASASRRLSWRRDPLGGRSSCGSRPGLHRRCEAAR